MDFKAVQACVASFVSFALTILVYCTFIQRGNTFVYFKEMNAPEVLGVRFLAR